jgi:hypothetical protein
MRLMHACRVNRDVRSHKRNEQSPEKRAIVRASSRNPRIYVCHVVDTTVQHENGIRQLREGRTKYPKYLVSRFIAILKITLLIVPEVDKISQSWPNLYLVADSAELVLRSFASSFDGQPRSFHS